MNVHAAGPLLADDLAALHDLGRVAQEAERFGSEMAVLRGTFEMRSLFG
jgi:hypothetical protein